MKPNYKKASIILAIIVVVLIGLFLTFRNSEKTDTPNDASSLGQVPDLALEDYEGNTVRLRDIDAEVTIINSWAVWCPFCKDELPDFVAINKEFGEKVAVVAIDRQEPLEKAKGFTDSIGITDEMTFLLDPRDDFYKMIGGFTMPETIFVDKNGEIRIHKRGPMREEEIREKVVSILNTNNQ